MKSILRVLTYLRRYPLLGALQLLCASTMAVAVIIFPLITRHLTGTIIPEGRHSEFLPWVILAWLGFFLKDGMNTARIMLNNHFEQKVIYDLRSDLYRKIQNLPLRWFDQRRTGDIMTRVVEDVTAMERILIDGIEFGLVALIQILAVGITMFVIDVQTALWAILPVPLLVSGGWLYSRNARSRYRAQRDAASDLNALLHDNIAGIRQIKAFTAETSEHRRFNEQSNILRQATLKLMRYWALYSPGMSFLNMTGYVLVLLIGGRTVMEGTMHLSDLLGFFLLLSLFYEPMNRLHQLHQMALSSRAAADRVFEIMDAQEEAEPTQPLTLPEPVQGHIHIRNLSFTYEDTPTLRDINLEIRPGETHALVGPTGAGKSTIVNLLNRFYHSPQGSITLDGHELRDLSKESLRRALGYVTQDPFLFNGTVRDNLLLAHPQANDQAMEQALHAARALDFVQHLPDQLDTIVGERGVKLSGGERQRLSIARALLKNPPILLLDEATASVDAETEQLIQQALDELLENRTALVIAHRLSTIRHATCIHVLEQGRIVERGTHEELLARNGLYANLAARSELFSA